MPWKANKDRIHKGVIFGVFVNKNLFIDVLVLDFRANVLQTTNSLIAKSLSGSPNYA